MSTPDYLVNPTCEGRICGRLTYHKGSRSYFIKGEPAMLEMAKRMFPGTRMDFGGRNKEVRFRATKRSIGDLNWFLLRFPIEIECREQFEKDRELAIDHAKQREKNSKLESIETPVEFKAELYDFQALGASFLIQNERALLGDDTGLGKTFTALGAAAKIKEYPVLVVPQPHLRRQWQRVIGLLFDFEGNDTENDYEAGIERGYKLCHVIKGLKPYPLPKVPFYICHYGLLRGWRHELQDMGFQVVIFDEVQELRHTGTKKYSVASEISSEAQYVWGASGTPIFGFGAEIWNVTNAIDYHCLSDYGSFTREWCTGYGSKIVEKPEVLGDYLMREGLMIRRRKSEVQSELPAVRRVVQNIDKNDDVYRKMILEAVKIADRYEDIKDWHKRGQASADVDRIARRATGISKAPYVAEFVKTLLDSGEKVLLFAWHHDVHDEYKRRLGKYSLVTVTGKQTQKQKDAAIKDFMEGHSDIMLMSLRSAAGYDGLQERATCVVFGELDWSPAVHQQCEARIQRMGVNEELDSILSYYCVANTGSDEVMQEALGLKTAQFTLMMHDKPVTEKDKAIANQIAQERIRKVIDGLRTKKTKKSVENISILTKRGESGSIKGKGKNRLARLKQLINSRRTLKVAKEEEIRKIYENKTVKMSG